jgi:hypothetical protein
MVLGRVIKLRQLSQKLRFWESPYGAAFKKNLKII